MGLIDCNAREGVGTGDREYPQALRGHLSGQTLVDNVMNDFESVDFHQAKMPLHDPSSESFDGELSPGQMLQLNCYNICQS